MQKEKTDTKIEKQRILERTLPEEDLDLLTDLIMATLELHDTRIITSFYRNDWDAYMVHTEIADTERTIFNGNGILTDYGTVLPICTAKDVYLIYKLPTEDLDGYAPIGDKVSVFDLPKIIKEEGSAWVSISMLDGYYYVQLELKEHDFIRS